MTPRGLLSFSPIAAIAIAASLMLFPGVEARTWTSADGSKTFEGELKSYDAASGLLSVTLGNGNVIQGWEEEIPSRLMDITKEWARIKPPVPYSPGKTVRCRIVDSETGLPLAATVVVSGEQGQDIGIDGSHDHVVYLGKTRWYVDSEFTITSGMAWLGAVFSEINRNEKKNPGGCLTQRDVRGLG